MKIKNKIKSKLLHSKKLSDSFDLDKKTKKLKLYKRLILFLSKNKKKILTLLIIIIIFIVIILISFSCLVYASFMQGKTYPKASVFNINVGKLNNKQLNVKLNNIKSEFDKKKITLTNSKDKYIFGLSEIGMTIDVKATNKAVWSLNDLNLIDKVRLITGNISNNIKPIISVDYTKCTNLLSTISIDQVDPIDAKIYFDKDVKIESEKAGTKYNPTSNCREISKKLANNIFSTNVYLDNIDAKITKKDIKSVLKNIKLMAGKQLSLHTDNYQLDLSPEKLIALIEIKKNGSKVQVNWSQAKLDVLINNIALKVDVNDTDSPVLGACQYLQNPGGNWLDKEATKKIFNDLVINTSRSYALSITYHEPVIGTRSKVSPGNNGTVYLTYDDGMTYANQIMDYAACYGVKVTFFELGDRVGLDTAELHRAINEGHAIQSHGYEHAATDYGSGHDYTWQYNDIASSITAITNVTGVRPTYFRPPGGNRNDNTNAAAAANGVSLILWGVSSTDTVAEFGHQTICDNVVNGAYDGASVLMHSTKQKTADATPCIIEGLAAKGFNMEALR